MRLFYFLALSVALHLAVLAAWPSAMPLPHSGRKALRVALEARDGAASGKDHPPSPVPGVKAAERATPPVHRTHTRQAAARRHLEERRRRQVHLQVASATPWRPTPPYPHARKARPPRDVPPAPGEQVHAGDGTHAHPGPQTTAAARATAESTRGATPRPGRLPPYNTGEPSADGTGAPTPPARVSAAAPSPSSPIEAAPRPLAAVASQVMSKLFQRLRARFRYPLVARMRGWEGTVKVGLRVEADGTLSHLRVIETSGYSILDENSLRTVKAITRVSGAAGSLHGRHLDLVLPVKYRLTRGG